MHVRQCRIMQIREGNRSHAIEFRLTYELSGRLMSHLRAVNHVKAKTAQLRAWHFICHGPLQRKLDFRFGYLQEILQFLAT